MPILAILVWILFLQGIDVIVGWGMGMEQNVHPLMDDSKTILPQDIHHWGVPSSPPVPEMIDDRCKPLRGNLPRVDNQRMVWCLFGSWRKRGNSKDTLTWYYQSIQANSPYFLLPPRLPPFFFFLTMVGFLLFIVMPSSAEAVCVVFTAILLFNFVFVVLKTLV